MSYPYGIIYKKTVRPKKSAPKTNKQYANKNKNKQKKQHAENTQTNKKQKQTTTA
jgi:hypothetical protein